MAYDGTNSACGASETKFYFASTVLYIFTWMLVPWELSILIRQLFAGGSLFYFCPTRSHITCQVSQ